jgi:hypothetical protein
MALLGALHLATRRISRRCRSRFIALLTMRQR